ncbi:hypothetical protein B0H67DRAFT_593111 [Lasiosphaeris hirsuta]|uniref:Uncharacterized protein n=1 Tax=Lasiosphaeris hirsuta TaxID=260670 RepID=A0AA40DIQ7_9PEZI|nr:hypothetical protein B0H67DRAFT_593111 [Lasiosphaeris hirsuta]
MDHEWAGSAGRANGADPQGQTWGVPVHNTSTEWAEKALEARESVREQRGTGAVGRRCSGGPGARRGILLGLDLSGYLFTPKLPE